MCLSSLLPINRGIHCFLLGKLVTTISPDSAYFPSFWLFFIASDFQYFGSHFLFILLTLLMASLEIQYVVFAYLITYVQNLSQADVWWRWLIFCNTVFDLLLHNYLMLTRNLQCWSETHSFSVRALPHKVEGRKNKFPGTIVL